MDWHRDNTSDKKNYTKDTVISWGLEIKTKQNWSWHGKEKEDSRGNYRRRIS